MGSPSPCPHTADTLTGLQLQAGQHVAVLDEIDTGSIATR